MKVNLAEGTYVIGDRKLLMPDDVDPLWSIPVENGTYRDQYGSRYVITCGEIAVSLAQLIKHPHIIKNSIKASGCCGRQVNGPWWMLGWTRQFSVLWSRQTFEVDNDKLQIGPLTLVVDG
tara:strand:- start:27 stop:386 length:360 start_codon:yes stop_codon:yes gene_type:complete